MMLEVGDILYVRPDYLGVEEHISIEGICMSREDLTNRPFEVTQIRKTDYFMGRETHDICILWIDGLKWWWGQIGYHEPWIDMFISEKEYLRNGKIDRLLEKQ